MQASHQIYRSVRFAETDATGFVHFAAYIRMMEETEYSFLRSRGLRVVLSDAKGIIGFPRLSAEIEILEPLRFQDPFQVNLQLQEIDGKHIVYQFRILRSNDQVSRPVVTGKFKVACCRFPDNENPYAILTPDFIIDKLLGEKQAHE
ncbi:MAG: thioesterase family protein [Planctomycetota bacterium]